MSGRGEALARQFEGAIDELVQTVQGCSDEQWQARCGDEKWSVAATARHVGAQWPLEREYLDAAASGATAPAYTWDNINKKNEQHAKEFERCPKDDVVSLLRSGAPAIASWVRGLSDEQLDRQMSLPLADGAMVTTQQLIEGGVLIDHAVGHTKSIRAVAT